MAVTDEAVQTAAPSSAVGSPSAVAPIGAAIGDGLAGSSSSRALLVSPRRRAGSRRSSS